MVRFQRPEVSPSRWQRTVQVVPTALAGVAEQRDVTMEPGLKHTTLISTQ